MDYATINKEANTEIREHKKLISRQIKTRAKLRTSIAKAKIGYVTDKSIERLNQKIESAKAKGEEKKNKVEKAINEKRVKVLKKYLKVRRDIRSKVSSAKAKIGTVTNKALELLRNPEIVRKRIENYLLRLKERGIEKLQDISIRLNDKNEELLETLRELNERETPIETLSRVANETLIPAAKEGKETNEQKDIKPTEQVEDENTKSSETPVQQAPAIAETKDEKIEEPIVQELPKEDTKNATQYAAPEKTDSYEKRDVYRASRKGIDKRASEIFEEEYKKFFGQEDVVDSVDKDKLEETTPAEEQIETPVIDNTETVEEKVETPAIDGIETIEGTKEETEVVSSEIDDKKEETKDELIETKENLSRIREQRMLETIQDLTIRNEALARENEALRKTISDNLGIEAPTLATSSGKAR